MANRSSGPIDSVRDTGTGFQVAETIRQGKGEQGIMGKGRSVLIGLCVALLSIVGTGSSLAQTSDDAVDSILDFSATAEQYSAVVEYANTLDPVYGPAQAALVPDRTAQSGTTTQLNITDSVIHFDVQAPAVEPGQRWGVIVAFRQGEDSHSVSLWSNGTWIYFPYGSDESIDGNYVQVGSPDRALSVDLVVLGDEAWLGANGGFITSLDASSFTGPGNITVAAAITGDYTPAVGFAAVTDLTVWEIDPAAVAASTGSGASTGSSAQTGSQTSENSYTSPSHGYTIAWDDEWAKVDEQSSDGIDFLSLESTGGVFALVVGIITGETAAECINNAFSNMENRDGYSNVVFTSPVETIGNYALAVVSYTRINSSGNPVEGRDRISCWAVPDKGLIVQLDQIVLPNELLPNLATMIALEGFVAEGVAALESGTTGTTGQEVAAATEVPLPTPAGGTTVEVLANSYTSPKYGYGISWNETWTEEIQESTETRDFLRLANDDGVLALLTGEALPAGETDCFTWLAGEYEAGADYSNVRPVPDTISTLPDQWDRTGLISLTFTSPSTGQSSELVNYLSCSVIPELGAVVSLEQILSLAELPMQFASMDALRAEFVPASSTGSQTTTTETGTQSVAPSYTSINVGYSWVWDDTWTIDDQSWDPNFEYVTITNGTVLATLIGEALETPITTSCFDWIAEYYQSNEDFANVRAIADPVSEAPDLWDTTGVMAMTRVNTEDGVPEPQINYVACSIDEDLNVVISLEQFLEPADAQTQIEAMNALRNGFIPA